MTCETATDWRTTTWGEVAALRYGKALKDYRGAIDGVEVFGTNGPIGFTDESLADGPGVIVGRKGAYRGVHLARGPFWVIDTAYYLDPDPEEIDSIWAYYSLLTTDINALDSGSAIPSLSREDFYAVAVRVPPIAEQRAIAKVLLSIDERITWCSRSVGRLRSLAVAIARSGEARGDGVHLGTISALDRTTVSAGSLAGSTWSHYSIPSFDIAERALAEDGRTIKSGKFRVPPNCVLLSKLNPVTPRVWLPDRDHQFPPVASTEFLPLVPANVGPEVLFALVSTPAVNRQMLERVTGSTGSHQRVRPEDIVTLTVCDPSLLRPPEIEALSDIGELLRDTRHQADALRDLRASLHRPLLSGRLRIPDPTHLAEEVA